MGRRVISVAALLAFAGGFASSATLEKLALDEMVAKSTRIVRGRVTDLNTIRRGAIIYTTAKVAVMETWKGAESNFLEVNIPGGSMAGVRQTFSGAPEVTVGSDYVFFLWAGRSGNLQIVGLSQGLLDLKPVLGGNANGNAALGQLQAVRAPISETLLDPVTHKQVADDAISMPLDQLRARVKRALAAVRD